MMSHHGNAFHITGPFDTYIISPAYSVTKSYADLLHLRLLFYITSVSNFKMETPVFPITVSNSVAE